ncbi:MAG: redoxin family protein [Armatimonadetes bacterium]|nr:redoxin family protein [Armatimonadota bacterium]MDE2206092.1 redoxin family protein [Armatimonadota bacterium]
MPLFGLFALLAAVSSSSQHPVAGPAGSAPAFRLTSTTGAEVSIRTLAGHPAVLWFFCGCPWCHAAAASWRRRMRLAPPGTTTAVVFAGDAPAARRFASDTGLPALILPDPSLRVASSYHALLCPRVFVLSAGGRILYTNNGADDAPRTAAPALIAGRALALLSAAKQSGDGATGLAVHGEAGTVTQPGGVVRTVLGAVDALAMPVVSRSFTITNRTARPELLRLAPSCSCITARFSSAVPDGPMTLLPGASAKILVHLDALALTGGPFWKAVLVESGAGSAPYATLVLSGATRPAASFVPLLVAMNGAAGSSEVGVTQVTLGARLRAAVLRGVCSNPWVKVEPPPGGHAGAWRLTMPASAPGGMVVGAFWLEEALAGGHWRRVTAEAVLAGNRAGPIAALPAYVRLRPWSASQTYRLRLLGPAARLARLSLRRSPAAISASLSRDGSALTVKMLQRRSAPWQGEVLLAGGGSSVQVPVLPPSG